MTSPRDLVHFVGSVPLKDSEEVFRTLANELGDCAIRFPDGETGERIKWIVFQQKMLQQHPAMEVDETIPPLKVRNWDGKVFREIHRLKMKDNVDPNSVDFVTTYDTAAKDSYAVFSKMREAKVIRPGARFLIALPTAMASGLMYVSPSGRERYVAAYERSLVTALKNIFDALPHDDITIQFDVCQEILMMENYFPEDAGPYRKIFFEQFKRLGSAVPSSVELGFHLCYGSPGDENLVRPATARSLVDLMNDIGDAVKRRIDFFHIPVPRAYTDGTFFAPLRDWKKRPETRLYLGLVTRGDTAGNVKRIEAAKQVIPDFGVASECGWGRTDPARLPEIFSDHRKAAEAL